MDQFIPSPKFSLEWWQETELQASLDGLWSEDFPIGPDSWIVWCHPSSEFMAPMWGYPILFPTVTDALYWFRYQIFPSELYIDDGIGKDAVLSGTFKDMAVLIDAAPVGTYAEHIVHKIWDECPFFRVFVLSVQSIHQYLAEISTEKEWRLIFDDPTIRLFDGKLNFEQTRWNELRDLWRSELYDSFDLGGNEIVYDTFLSKRRAIPIADAIEDCNKSIEDILQAIETKQLNGLQIGPEYFSNQRSKVDPPFDWFIYDDEAYEKYSKN